MNLIEALDLEINSPSASTQCPIFKIAQKASDEDKTALFDALSDSKIPHIVIGNALKKYGHRVGKDAISRHRRRLCSCP